MGDSFTDQEQKIIDAYAENATIEEMAYTTALSPVAIRDALQEPRVLREAMLRKAAATATWAFGAGLERLKTIVEKGSEKDAISAFREINRTLGRVAQPTEPLEPAKEVKSIEAEIMEQ